MPLYDLVVDGVNDFYARRPGAKRLVRREPLSGIVDGVNKTFLTAHPTWLQASLKVYVETDMYSAGDLALVDAEGGVVQFAAAPSVQPLADYTAVPLTTQQIVYYAWAGFTLMEHLWTRGLLLSSSATTYAQAAYDSAAIYVVSRSGSAVADPTCGSLTFSTSPTQRAVLAQCIELAYLDSMLFEASLTDVNYRERLGGAAIETLGRPRNIALARNAAYSTLQNAIYAAMDEANPAGDHYGAITTPPHTDEYNTVWEWQSGTNGLIPRGIDWGNP